MKTAVNQDKWDRAVVWVKEQHATRGEDGRIIATTSYKEEEIWARYVALGGLIFNDETNELENRMGFPPSPPAPPVKQGKATESIARRASRRIKKDTGKA
jgi:hypothetical protein